MKDINSWLAIAAIVLGVVFLAVVISMPILVEKTKNSVIEDLRKYSPGPYGPGFDPDKVDPNFFRSAEQNQTQPQSWQTTWEQQRISGT